MSEWLKGLISGGILVIIGFLLAVIWDIYKYKRDIKKREETVWSAVKEDLESNMSISLDNQKLLQTELTGIDEKKTVIVPLNLFQSGFWDLLKINLPRKLPKVDILVKVRKAAQLTNQINEKIRSRENYRINNQAMSNYLSRMRLYDQILVRDIGGLLNSLKELEPLL